MRWWYHTEQDGAVNTFLEVKLEQHINFKFLIFFIPLLDFAARYVDREHNFTQLDLCMYMHSTSDKDFHKIHSYHCRLMDCGPKISFANRKSAKLWTYKFVRIANLPQICQFAGLWFADQLFFAMCKFSICGPNIFANFGTSSNPQLSHFFLKKCSLKKCSYSNICFRPNKPVVEFYVVCHERAEMEG